MYDKCRFKTKALNRIGDRFNVRSAKRLWLPNGFSSASKAECKGDVADDGKTSKKDPALLKGYGKTEAGRVRYFKRSSKYNTKYARLSFVNGTAS